MSGPLKCGHSEEYRCKFCKACCQCTHVYDLRDGKWWVKCKRTLKSHKCLGPASSLLPYEGEQS